MRQRYPDESMEFYPSQQTRLFRRIFRQNCKESCFGQGSVFVKSNGLVLYLDEDLPFEELEDFLSGENSLESEVERQEIIGEVNKFLKKLPKKKRQIFIERYWGCCKLSEIGAHFGMSVSSVSVYLGRINKQLKEHLKKRGFEL